MGSFINEKKLETGKLAYMVVLSIDPMQIKDIQVRETIKKGQGIYSTKG